jgi:hypothetical protein
MRNVRKIRTVHISILKDLPAGARGLPRLTGIEFEQVPSITPMTLSSLQLQFEPDEL